MTHRTTTFPSQKQRKIFWFNWSKALLFVSFFLLGLPLDGNIPEPPQLTRDIYSNSMPPSYLDYAVWGGIYGIALFLVISRYRAFAHVRLLVPAIPLILFTASLSVSPYARTPASDLLQIIGFLCLCLIGGFLIRSDFSAAIQTMYNANTLSLILNIIFVVILPGLTISGDGRWSSLVGNPNFLGSIAVVNLFLILTMSIARHITLKNSIVMLCIPITILIGSRSATSSISGIFVLFIALYNFTFNLKVFSGKTARFVIIVSVLSAAIFYDDLLNFFMTIMGKDQTLTGRTIIWERTVDAIKLHPFFGYGAGVTTYDLGITTWPTNFHNGYLHILVSFGIAGLFAFGVTFVTSIIAAYKYHAPVEKFFVLAFLSTFAIYSGAEVPMFLWRHPMWVMYYIVVFSSALGRRSRTL